MAERSIDTGKAIGYGWASVKKDFWYFVGLALVVTILSSFGQNQHGHPSNWSIVGLFVSAWLTCGYTAIALSYQAGKKLPFENLFTNFTPFWRVLGAMLILGVIVVVGFAFLIIPGVYFALKYQFTIYLILDKHLGIGQAMQHSAKMTEGQKMSLLGFDLICLAVILLGLLALGVGILVAMPVTWLAGVVVYRKLSS